MSRTAILHLGSYKTGSSSLQNLLHANRDRLAEHGVLYPQSGLVHSEIIGHRHRRLIQHVMRGQASSFVMEELSRELEAADQHTVIISSEAWSHPRHLPMLGGFVAELNDLGFDDIIGVVFLRRLIDYKISHYREFTVRHGNKDPFDTYGLKLPGMFDYLFLVRNLKAIFGSCLHVIDYSRTNDTVADFFDAIDLSGILPKLEPTKRSNIRSIEALGVEIKRQANIMGLPHKKGMDLIRHIEARHPNLFTQRWTERERSEEFVYGRHYRKELAEVTGWPADNVTSCSRTCH